MTDSMTAGRTIWKGRRGRVVWHVYCPGAPTRFGARWSGRPPTGAERYFVGRMDDIAEQALAAYDLGTLA